MFSFSLGVSPDLGISSRDAGSLKYSMVKRACVLGGYRVLKTGVNKSF